SCLLRKHEKDQLHEDDVHQDDADRRQDDAAGRRASDAFGAARRGESEVRGNRPDDESEYGGLERRGHEVAEFNQRERTVEVELCWHAAARRLSDVAT